MTKLLFHVGLPKTGTSYMQQAIHANHDVLVRQGVGLFKRQRDHHAFVVSARSGVTVRARHLGLKSEADKEAQHAALLNKLEGLTRKFSVSVLTSEMVGTAQRAVVERLRDELLSIFSSVEVVMWLRRNDYLANSNYSRAVKNGHTDPPDGAFAHKELDRFALAKIVQRWQGVFGVENVAIYPYLERFRAEPSRVTCVTLGHAGLDGTFFGEGTWKWPEQMQNVSLTADAAAVLLEINPYIPITSRAGHTNLGPRNRLVAKLSEQLPGPPVRLTPDAMEIVHRRMASDLEPLRDMVSGPDWSEWWEQPPANSQPMNRAQAADVAAVMAQYGVPNGDVAWGGHIDDATTRQRLRMLATDSRTWRAARRLAAKRGRADTSRH